MNRIYFLPCLLFCQIILAQTPVVNNLHYKYTEAFKSPKKTDVKYNWFNFNLDSNVLVITTEKPLKSFDMGALDKTEAPFTEVIDRNNDAIVVIFGNKKNYILEQLAMFPSADRLVQDDYEEDQVINGYKCRCYKNPPVAAPAGATGMGAQIYNSLAMATQIKIWVTTDLAMNDTFNPYILGVLRGAQVNPKFKGVIVKMEKKLGYQDKTYTYTYELDTTKLHDKREALVMPWNEAEPRTALLEAPINGGEMFDSKAQQSVSVVKSNSAHPTTHKTGDGNATCTGESHNSRHKRMKEFLEKTVDKGNRKSSIFTTVNIPCNFWRTF